MLYTINIIIYFLNYFFLFKAWKLQEEEHYRNRAKAMMICGYALDIFAIFFAYACFYTIYFIIIINVNSNN